MSSLCYLNGEILETSKAAIGVSDLALQRGYGVFDYARTYRRTLFHFDDHLERLRKSANALHLELPLSAQEITSIAEHLIQESEFSNPAIRLMLTGGYKNTPFLQNPNFMIIPEELPSHPASIYITGVDLALVEYQRELPHIKTINYINALRLEPFRHEKNVYDILYHAEHGITECPRSNFFAFQGDTLITPPNQVLPGITRMIILQLASDLFPIETRKIFPEELASIEEAFLTATSKGAVPVTKIDAQVIGTGLVGERTRRIMEAYQDYTDNYCLNNPAPGKVKQQTIEQQG